MDVRTYICVITWQYNHVFFLVQFAKQYINDMPLSLKMYDIAVVRMEMGEMVLNNSGTYMMHMTIIGACGYYQW